MDGTRGAILIGCLQDVQGGKGTGAGGVKPTRGRVKNAPKEKQGYEKGLLREGCASCTQLAVNPTPPNTPHIHASTHMSRPPAQPVGLWGGRWWSAAKASDQPTTVQLVKFSLLPNMPMMREKCTFVGELLVSELLFANREGCSRICLATADPLFPTPHTLACFSKSYSENLLLNKCCRPLGDGPALTLCNGGPVQPLSSTCGEERSDFGRIECIMPPSVTWMEMGENRDINTTTNDAVVW